MIHFHRYRIVGAEPYWDTSYDGMAAMTMVYKSCKKCQKTKVDLEYGHWQTSLVDGVLTLVPYIG